MKFNTNVLEKWSNLHSFENKKQFKREMLLEKKINKNQIDFENILPISIQISAKTIGLDLVSVQPLSAPTGLLYYLDSYEHKNLFNRKIIVEKLKKSEKKYIPSYSLSKFRSPGVYVQEYDHIHIY